MYLFIVCVFARVCVYFCVVVCVCECVCMLLYVCVQSLCHRHSFDDIN